MSNHEKSVSETYAINFQNSEPKFYTRIPNIIDHLTYTVEENGVKIKKRLSVYAKELYRILRMIASDDGKCWNTTESLAEKVGCSVGAIYNAKKELLMPMDQLDGSALILEKKVKLNKTNSSNQPFSTMLCTYTILDIWKWNNAFMATLKHQAKYGAESSHETDPPPKSPHENVNLGTNSPHEANNNIPKNPIVKEQQPTEASASAHVCSSKIQKAKMFLSSEQRKAFDWMIEKRCNPNAALKIVKTFCSQEIQNASAYLINQLNKNKAKGVQIPNIWGYFTSILKGRYWENVQQMHG